MAVMFYFTLQLLQTRSSWNISHLHINRLWLSTRVLLTSLSCVFLSSLVRRCLQVTVLISTLWKSSPPDFCSSSCCWDTRAGQTVFNGLLATSPHTHAFEHIYTLLKFSYSFFYMVITMRWLSSLLCGIFFSWLHMLFQFKALSANIRYINAKTYWSTKRLLVSENYMPTNGTKW